MSRQLEFIALHHSGGLGNDRLAKTQHLTWVDIDNAHKEKYAQYAETWAAYKSSLGYYGGYNFFINQFGQRFQFRKIGEETAAQKNHNLDTVSICLAGNFTPEVEMPTAEQIKSLSELLSKLTAKDFSGLAIEILTAVKIPYQNIMPHRLFSGALTECNGLALPDNWGRKQLTSYYVSRLEGLKLMLADLFRRSRFGFSRYAMNLGARPENCFESDQRG